MVKIEINGKSLFLKKGLLIIQALEKSGVKVPRFCYHEKLTIAGNCRMCLVEIGKVSKPIASCTVSLVNNMQIFTNTILVNKARESVLELLLINHPLDCPICDQGGECDLQDQSFLYGNDKSRYYELKRSVSDKLISPSIKTIMTRCIHCTRCVRFLNEVVGDYNLGVTGRGNKMEIGNYLNSSLNSEFSGNIIDLCPVGALTSKSYSFVSRSWELKNYETIDILDSLGSNIVIQMRGTQLLRILPKVNDEINEEWITDKVRFSLDGLFAQRLNSSYYQIRNKYVYKFTKFIVSESSLFIHKFIADWSYLYSIFKEQLFFYYSFKEKNIIVGNQVNIESLNYLKFIFYYFNFNSFQSQYNFLSNQDLQSNYFSSLNIKDFENIDICLLLGCNLRLESPLLNIKLRKSYLKSNTLIASVGPYINPIYDLKKLGNSTVSLYNILLGKSKFNINFKKSLNTFFIYGFFFSSLINNFDYFLQYFRNYNIKFINVSSLHSYISLSEFGLSLNNNFSSPLGSFNYLVNSDEIHLSNLLNFNVYQGFYDDRSACLSDIVLASNSFFEEISSFIDFNGKVVLNKNIISFSYFFNYNLRNSHSIISNLLYFLLVSKKIDNLNVSVGNINLLNQFYNKSFNEQLYNTIINNFISNYYKTNNLTRASLMMSKITQFQNSGNLNY